MKFQMPSTARASRFAAMPAAVFIALFMAVCVTGCAQPTVWVPAPVGGEPALNVSSYRHGNLADAQELVRGAYDKLGAAQAANNDALGGHAARARELLREAGEEIKLSAIAANRR